MRFAKQRRQRTWKIACASWAFGILVAACSSSDSASPDLTFHGDIAPLKDFSFATGLVPAGSPAQVDLALSADSSLKVDAAFTPTSDGLKAKPGGGKLALDVHLKLAGKLKVDTPLKKYDGELPGLKDIDVPIAAAVAFDPFLLEDGQEAEVKADVPETTLPPIPLGGVPGTLTLRIVQGSTLNAKFHGTCVSVTGRQGSYAGSVALSGKLVLKGTLALELPAPFNKSIDLPNIEVPLPSAPVAFASEPLAIPDAADSEAGAACANAPAPDGGSSGDVDGGSDASALLSSFSVSIEDAQGKPAKGVPISVTTTVRDGLRIVGLNFAVPSMPQLGPKPQVNIFAPEGAPEGARCSALGVTLIQGIQFAPDDGTDSHFSARPLSGACGLNVTQSGPTKLTGSFDGPLREANAASIPKTVTMHVTFDVPLALATQK